MASSLINRIRKNAPLVRGASGELEEGTVPVSQLAGQAGLPSTPIDPMSQAALGANPHQTKMAGTPAQVQNATRQALEPSQSLQASDRTRQAPSTQSASQQANSQRSEALQQLGGLGERVQTVLDAAEKQVFGAAGQAAPAPEVAPASNLAGLPTDPAKLDQLRAAARTYQQSGGKDLASLTTINQLLGRNTSNSVSPAEVEQLYGSAVDNIAKAGGAAAVQSLTVQDLAASPQFGYSLDSLGQLLGVSPSDLGKYSVQQLEDRIHSISQQDYQQSQQALASAQSGQVGQAERQLAREQGRDLSASGVRSSEQQMAALDQSISNAERVQFAGKDWDIQELLGSEEVSNVIRDYLNAPEGSELRKQLEQTEPTLVDFISKHKQLLDESVQTMQKGAEKYSGIQSANAAKSSVQGVQLPPELMEQLIPGWSGLQSSELDTSKQPFFHFLKGLPANTQKSIASNASALVQSNPELAREFAHMNEKDWKKLHLEKGMDSPVMRSYLQSKEQASAVGSIDPHNVDAMVQFFTGDSGMNKQTIDKQLSDSRMASVLFGTKYQESPFDVNHDGRVDPPATLASSLRDYKKPLSLTEAIAGKTPAKPHWELPGATIPPGMETVAGKLGKYAVDGLITPKDLERSGLTDDELLQLSDSHFTDRWPENVRETIKDRVVRFRSGVTGSLLNGFLPPTHDIGEAQSDRSTESYTGGSGTDYSESATIPSQGRVDKFRQLADSEAKQLEDLQAQWKEKEATNQTGRYSGDTVQARIADMTNQVAALRKQADQLESERNITIQSIQDRVNAALARHAQNEAEAKKRGTVQGKLATGASTIRDIINPATYVGF